MKFPVSTPLRLRVLVGALVLGSLVLGTASAAYKFINEGMTAPEFGGEDLLSGEVVSWKPGSGRDEDKVVLIVFWATWSPRSIELLEDLKNMSGQYGSEGFRVIAVNVDAQEVTPSILKQVTETTVQLDLPFPVVVDQGLEVFYAYGVIAVPSLALLDSGGTLRYGPSGYSYTIRDRIIDSTEVLLGLKEAGELTVIARGYKPVPKASRYYNLGRQMAGKRMYDRALSNLELAVAADSNFGTPLSLMGQIHLVTGDLEEAEAEFARSAALDDLSVTARTGLGRAVMLQGRLAEAEKELRRAVEMDPTYTPALRYLAECRRQAGDGGEARELLDVALVLNPRDPGVLAAMGRLQRDEGELSSAVASFRTAMEQLVTLPIIGASD